MQSRRIMLWVGLFVFVAGVLGQVEACDMAICLAETNAVVIAAGNPFVIEVHFRATHRNCPVPLSATQFTTDGLKILGATDWKTDADGRSVRKFKVEPLRTGDVSFCVARSCKRGGANKTLNVHVEDGAGDNANR